MTKHKLNEQELQLWYKWKGTFHRIFGRVIKELADRTGLSEGDYGVMDRLDLLGDGSLRQQELAESMDWDKSRLSHHLTRMEKRRLVTRQPLENDRGVQVLLTPLGKSALEDARPVVSMAIRTHFLDQLTDQDVESITKLAERSKKSSGGPRLE